MDLLSREKSQKKQKGPQTQGQQLNQQQNPQCVQTKLHLWTKDQFQEVDIDYLNQVFPEKLTKLTMQPGCQFIFHFLTNSLNYWVQLKDPSEEQQSINQLSPQLSKKLSKKDIKYIQQVLQEQGCDNSPNYNRWGQYFNKSEKFFTQMDQQDNFVIPQGGQKVKEYQRMPKVAFGDPQPQKPDNYNIYKYKGSNKAFIEYKHRFQILFLFYIDGVSFVDEDTDQWQYYIIFKEEQKQNKNNYTFVGVLSKFIFKITSLRRRQRISQVFVLPTYQNQGHGSQLIDYVYRQCINDSNCFEITTQVPSFEYQCLRDYRQTTMLIKGINQYTGYINYNQIPICKSLSTIQDTQNNLLCKQKIRRIKQQIKIPGNQIERLVNLLIYAKIIQNQYDDPDCDMNKAIFQQYTRDRIIYNRSAFKSRKKLPHITFNGQVAEMKQFFLEKSKQDLLRSQDEIQQILLETLDGFRRVIFKLRKNRIID